MFKLRVLAALKIISFNYTLLPVNYHRWILMRTETGACTSIAVIVSVVLAEDRLLARLMTWSGLMKTSRPATKTLSLWRCERSMRERRREIVEIPGRLLKYVTRNMSKDILLISWHELQLTSAISTFYTKPTARGSTTTNIARRQRKHLKENGLEEPFPNQFSVEQSHKSTVKSLKSIQESTNQKAKKNQSLYTGGRILRFPSKVPTQRIQIHFQLSTVVNLWFNG